MEITIRSPKLQDYDRFSNIMNQVQQLHVDWRPDVYKPANPLITKEMFEEILESENWYVAETNGIVVGVLELIKRHVESPSQVTKIFYLLVQWLLIRNIEEKESDISFLKR